MKELSTATGRALGKPAKTEPSKSQQQSAIGAPVCVQKFSRAPNLRVRVLSGRCPKLF